MNCMNRRCKTAFQKAELSESTEYLNNPGCGWYRIYPFSLEVRPDFEELFWCLSGEERLALLLIDIGAFREGSISKEALSVLAEILSFFKEHEKEMIVRPVYDREGKGMEREPDFIQTVEEHMGQLGPVLASYADDICLVQGLLIGSWGEMHDSRFLAESRLKRLFEVWRRALGEDIPLAVRTPQQWRMIYSESAVPGADKTGLFDDGMFGSPDNLGTYGPQTRKEAGWKGRWCREEELSFISGISAEVMYGGEAVGTSAEMGELTHAVAEMRRTGLSYLNRTHDARCLKRWEQSFWQEDGVWNGCNGLDYIGCHMGCRFVVRNAQLKTKSFLSRSFGEWDCLKVTIENVGFSFMREEALLVLEFDAENGGRLSESCLVLPGNIPPGRGAVFAIKLPASASGESYEVFLRMERKKDKKSIFFANCPKSERVHLGSAVCT